MFRVVTEKDFDLIYEIFMEDSVNPFMSWELISKKEFIECFNELAARDDFLVFEENNTVVGVVTITRGKRRKKHVASVGSLAIPTKYQGKGVATRMLTLLINSLREDGIRRLELIVESDNLGALSLYEKLGFQKEGTLREYFKRANDSKAITDYIMSKLL